MDNPNAPVGEFTLIQRITERLTTSDDVLVGPGDDAAVIAAPDGRVVATTDVLVDGVHFRRDWSSAADIGTRAAAANLADVVAMGARPTALLVGLALPSHIDAAWVMELADGLNAEAVRAGASVAGGDVVRSEHLTLSITALGDLGGRDPVMRSGARAGEVVAICGRIGWAAAGLAILTRGFRSPRVLADAHRRPVPDYAGGLAGASAATALCDVSDGLAADLGHIARASGVAIDLDGDLLSALVTDPMRDVAAALGGADPMTWIVAGGDDHAFAGTFPPSAVTAGWTVVGHVAAGGAEGSAVGQVTVDGVMPKETGHEHVVG